MYTVAQMHAQFKDELDKVDSLATPNFTSTEIDRLLNEAQERFIKERLPVSRTKLTTVEETQRRMDDLSTLIRQFSTSTFVINNSNKVNGVFVVLPIDYKYTLDQGVNITYTDSCGNVINPSTGLPPARADKANGEVFQCTHNQFNKIIKDPFHQPVENQVLQLPFGDVLGTALPSTQPSKVVELIATDNAVINIYFLRYLKEPRQISLTGDVTCELGETQAIEVVKMAVAEVEKIISDPRYQIQKTELAVTE